MTAVLLSENTPAPAPMLFDREEIEAAHKTLVSARRHMLVTDAARVAQWEWDVPSGRIFLSTTRTTRRSALSRFEAA